MSLSNRKQPAGRSASWRQYKDTDARLARMFLQAYGRTPDAIDRAQIGKFLKDQAGRYPGAGPGDTRVWADLAHVIFQLEGIHFC